MVSLTEVAEASFLSAGGIGLVPPFEPPSGGPSGTTDTLYSGLLVAEGEADSSDDDEDNADAPEGSPHPAWLKGAVLSDTRQLSLFCVRDTARIVPQKHPANSFQ